MTGLFLNSVILIPFAAARGLQNCCVQVSVVAVIREMNSSQRCVVIDVYAL